MYFPFVKASLRHTSVAAYPLHDRFATREPEHLREASLKGHNSCQMFVAASLMNLPRLPMQHSLQNPNLPILRPVRHLLHLHRIRPNHPLALAHILPPKHLPGYTLDLFPFSPLARQQDMRLHEFLQVLLRPTFTLGAFVRVRAEA